MQIESHQKQHTNQFELLSPNIIEMQGLIKTIEGDIATRANQQEIRDINNKFLDVVNRIEFENLKKLFENYVNYDDYSVLEQKY